MWLDELYVWKINQMVAIYGRLGRRVIRLEATVIIQVGQEVLVADVWKNQKMTQVLYLNDKMIGHTFFLEMGSHALRVR